MKLKLIDWALAQDIPRNGGSIAAGNLPAKVVWIKLARLGALALDGIEVSRTELAEGTGLSPRAVDNAMADLEAAGMLKRKPAGRSRVVNIYHPKAHV